MKRISVMILLMVTVIAIVGISLRAFAADKVPRMTKEDLKKQLGNSEVVIIDVRVGGSWNSSDSKIKGAIREDPSEVSSWINKYSKDKTLVFYCS